MYGLKTLNRTILLASILPASWLGMMLVHEIGHVLGAWVTGGTVERVVFHPLAISRTDVHPNPSPLVVSWAGAVGGCLIPLLALGVMRLVRAPGRFLLRFFAGFCLVANGLYLGVGLIGDVGDVGDLRRAGAPAWQLLGFAAVTVALGVTLWHRQGVSFGLGKDGREVPLAAAATSLAALVLLVIGGLVFGGG
ncbi:MAG: hypothetical protein ACYTGP_06175 [Planctomycetota bacterium]|jgi:hypothetical protein